MKLIETGAFRRSFEKLPTQVKLTAKKQFGLFFQNMAHPSLHTEKLEPKEKNIWSFRINRNYRIIFMILPDQTILLLNVGPHDIYKKR